MEFLDSPVMSGVAYDLVVAADVFNYFGDLTRVFQGVRRHLSNSGAFAFSVEELDSGTFTLNTTGRYAHCAAYIQRLAQETGFRIESAQSDVIRSEHGVGTPGLFYLLSCAPAQEDTLSAHIDDAVA